jgi:very-short-patch-repair endonuclease
MPDEFLQMKQNESHNKEIEEWEFADPFYYGILKQYARENRRNMTMAERLLWNELRANRIGLKFYRQYIIRNYIVDFVCLSCKLIIEVDGCYHSEPQQEFDDGLRQKDLEGIGFHILRFTNEQVEFDTKSVIQSILSSAQKNIL